MRHLKIEKRTTVVGDNTHKVLDLRSYKTLYAGTLKDCEEYLIKESKR